MSLAPPLSTASASSGAAGGCLWHADPLPLLPHCWSGAAHLLLVHVFKGLLRACCSPAARWGWGVPHCWGMLVG